MRKIPAPPQGRSLRQAVITAVVLILVMIACAFIGPDAFAVLAFVVVALALFEALDALVRSGRKPVLPFGLLCGGVLMGVAYLARPSLAIVVLAGTAFGSLLLALRPDRGPTPASDAALMTLVVAWVTGGGAAALSILRIENGGLAMLVAFVLTAACDDIGAYFAGTKFGRHKMAPSISPNKSWEGFAGGFACALVAGAISSLAVDELNLAHGLAIGGICALLAPAGDLVESLFKREIGIKDSGRLLPGHGGFLDRLDAIIFCAPFVFFYLRFAVV